MKMLPALLRRVVPRRMRPMSGPLRFDKSLPDEARCEIEALFKVLQCENCGTRKEPPLPEHRMQCAFLRRLANDPQMRAVYRSLYEEFGEGLQWGPLIAAAVGA